ncbi:hypothetical protein BH23ACT11_BH23ACT11_17940 [soil metagenome]
MKSIGRGFGSHLRRNGIAYAVLLLSVILTLLAWRYVVADVEQQNRVRFEQTVNATQNAVGQITSSYIDAIFGARALFLSSNRVEGNEWTEYVQGIDPQDRLRGFQALAYVQYVPPSKRKDFEDRSRSEGLPALTPQVEAGGERTAYFPVVYVGPSDRANSSVLSNDLYTEAEHRRAMNRARDTSRPQATPMIYVLTESDRSTAADLALHPGFAVYLPVYKQDEPRDNAAERQRALDGFVMGSFSMDGLLERVFGEPFEPGIDLEVYDGVDIGESNLLYNDDGIKNATDPQQDRLFTDHATIDIAGRKWTLYFSSLDEFEANAESDLPVFVLVSGLLVSFLLFGITWLLIRSRTRAEDVSERLEYANRSLEDANKELESFSYSVSHDLRAPLRTIDGFSRIMLEDFEETLDKEGRNYLQRVRNASRHMGELIDDLLTLSRVTRGSLRQERVDLSSLVEGVARELREADTAREAEFLIEENVTAYGDENLLLVVVENLLGNACKFTRDEPLAQIEFGTAKEFVSGYSEGPVYCVRDNGAGFDMEYADKLFGAFQRLHRAEQFEGTGIGLATVRRIVRRHGGRVWAEGKVGSGATFYFTLGEPHSPLKESKSVTKELA